MTPDTVITLSTGQKYMVLETAEEIVEKVVYFRKLVNGQLNSPTPVYSGSRESAEDADATGHGK
jgi:hypothetical protein